MPRTFEPQPLITLPRQDATGMVALTSALLTAAEAEASLPDTIERARKRLHNANKALKEALRERLGSSANVGQRSRKADAHEDAAFACLFDLLAAFARLPDSFAESGQAKSVLEALFPDGLKFTQLAYRLEWAEAQTRLEKLRKDGLDTVVRSLGGSAILRYLYASHAEYGEALGITAPLVAPAPQPLLREPLEAAATTLRSYILRITAERDDGDAEMQALCERLLAPLRDWPTSAGGTGRDDDDPADPAPAGDKDPKDPGDSR